MNSLYDIIILNNDIEPVAKNLLYVLDDETIALKTGLTLDDIKKLRE